MEGMMPSSDRELLAVPPVLALPIVVSLEGDKEEPERG